MRCGWYQRFREEYARLVNSGVAPKQAREMAIQMLKQEG